MFLARLSARDMYCSCARVTCADSGCTLCGSRPQRLNARRSPAGKADPLFRYGVLRRAAPVRAQSMLPLVLSGRWAYLDCFGEAMADHGQFGQLAEAQGKALIYR